jgi:hypothetical protein
MFTAGFAVTIGHGEVEHRMLTLDALDARGKRTPPKSL